MLQNPYPGNLQFGSNSFTAHSPYTQRMAYIQPVNQGEHPYTRPAYNRNTSIISNVGLRQGASYSRAQIGGFDHARQGSFLGRRPANTESLGFTTEAANKRPRQQNNDGGGASSEEEEDAALFNQEASVEAKGEPPQLPEEPQPKQEDLPDEGLKSEEALKSEIESKPVVPESSAVPKEPFAQF